MPEAQQIADAIRASSEPHWLEVAYWWSQIAIAFIAAGAAIFAGFQVRAMNTARAEQLRILNATLLMELDKRWDSGEMQRARRAFQDTFEQVNGVVASNHPNLRDTEKDQKIREEWTKTLGEMRKSAKPTYARLMIICGFFETVGLMVKREYISIDDALDLFAGPIINVGRCFRGHIKDREKEMGVPSGLYEHALELCDAAQHRTG